MPSLGTSYEAIPGPPDTLLPRRRPATIHATMFRRRPVFLVVLMVCTTLFLTTRRTNFSLPQTSPRNVFELDFRHGFRSHRAVAVRNAATTTTTGEAGDAPITHVIGACLTPGAASCAPFTEEAYLSCALKLGSGCLLTPCPDHHSRNFQCAFEPSKVFSQTRTTANLGDTISFNGVSSTELKSIPISVDLTAVPQLIDVYVLSDGTASMGKALNAVKQNALRLLQAFGEGANVALGTGMFRDEKQLTHGFQNLQAITEDFDAFKNGLTQLAAYGGGDYDEANLIGLYKVATDITIGWRTGSRRIVVYFGDYPGHEPSCAIPDVQVDRALVIDKLKEKGVTVIAVDFKHLNRAPKVYGCAGASPGATGQANDITSATGGLVLETRDQGEVMNKIVEAVGLLEKVIEATDTCEGLVTATFEPALPLTITAGQSARVQVVVSLTEAFCTNGGDVTCMIKFSEGGALLKPLTLSFSSVSCPCPVVIDFLTQGVRPRCDCAGKGNEVGPIVIYVGNRENQCPMNCLEAYKTNETAVAACNSGTMTAEMGEALHDSCCLGCGGSYSVLGPETKLCIIL